MSGCWLLAVGARAGAATSSLAGRRGVPPRKSDVLQSQAVTVIDRGQNGAREFRPQAEVPPRAEVLPRACCRGGGRGTTFGQETSISPAPTYGSMACGLSGSSDLVSGYCGHLECHANQGPMALGFWHTSEAQSQRSHHLPQRLTNCRHASLGAPPCFANASTTPAGPAPLHRRRCRAARGRVHKVRLAACVGVVVVPRLGDADSRQAPAPKSGH
ncbi:hypothetical protein MHUMG1_06086 [Metarhizium humberi]|uniref:Uncharacterized protein n=1 Tax=Metarhizium humberi TaxID=2596975 RepID=A0A9P8M9H2_9HYPO|nr:hypothetical protein MHUMG1_06086 [Metarhizium humberi]